MSREVGELEYDEGEALKSGAQYPEFSEGKEQIKNSVMPLYGGDIEVHLIDKEGTSLDELGVEEEEIKSEEEESPDNIQIEARFVAKKINELVNPPQNNSFKVYDRSIDSYRSVMYKDIVILMRATANWAPTFMEELNNAGIPVFADTATGYFETIEIKTIISLLQIIDNPMQDIPLISILRSPIEAFSPEDLIDIRMINKDITFYEALRAVKEDMKEEKYSLSHINETLRDKINKFINKLEIWRKKVRHMAIDEFIWYIYTETGYYGFAGAMPGGSQRQANLRVLFQRAKQYEKTSYKGLFNFINFINKLKNSSGDMGTAKILGENEDVVRIMSIHKSKGLEFPVVIVAGAGKNFNLMDMNKSVLFHGDLGLGPDYVDLERRISYATVVKQVLKKKIKVETLSEEMRILYVAFTRAKEKLIITGMVNNIEKTAEKWCNYANYQGKKIPEYALINAKSYLDWIGTAVVRHPNGNVLRELGENQKSVDYIAVDNSKWSINIWNRDQFKNSSIEEVDEDIVKDIESANLSNDLSFYNEEIKRRLSWDYKYSESCKIPAKFSVSELKRKFQVIDRENSVELTNLITLKKPLFLQDSKRMTAAERGTLMHLIMQHLDFNRVSSYEEIDAQVRNLVLKEFITEEERKEASIDKILKFFKSQLGKRMINAENVCREVPFYIEIDSTEIYKELPKDIYTSEKILIQGIIDCYFEEDDKLVLVDYKTDYVEELEEIREKYRIQIHYYTVALERITGKKVKDRYLYLFHKDKALDV